MKAVVWHGKSDVRVDSVSTFAYRYELRRGEEIIATGHLTNEGAIVVGQRISIGALSGVVREVEPSLADRELRLVIDLDVMH